MTVPSETSFVTYSGSGITMLFSITFTYLEQSDVHVYLDGVSKTLGVDYNFFGNNIEFVTPPASGVVILIQREVDFVQPTEFRTQGTFSPSVHEDQLDRVVFQTQQLARNIAETESDISDLQDQIDGVVGGSIPDATHTVAGKVSLSAQDMGAGLKTFVDGLNAGGHQLGGVGVGINDYDGVNMTQLAGVSASILGGGSSVPYVRRSSSWMVPNSCGSHVWLTSTATASRIYFTPVVFPENRLIEKIGLAQSQTGASYHRVGIYANSRAANVDSPGALLADGGEALGSTLGLREWSFSYMFEFRTIYWLALICGGTPTFYAIEDWSILPMLGTYMTFGGSPQVAPYTHLYAAGSGYALPATAPACTEGLGRFPTMMIKEAASLI